MKTFSAGFFCLWLMQSGRMAAQSSLRVASLTVVGATTGTLLEIPDNVQTKPQGIFDEAVLHRDLTRLIERYAADGFVYARIDSVTIIPAGGDSAVDIFVRIHEGKPALLKSIDVEGVRAVKEEDLKARFELAPGGLFSPSALESDIQRGLTFCEQSGYPFAKLAVKDVSFSEAADAILTSVILSVDEGQRVTISELRVEGNKSTKEYVILREARLQPDEIFDGRLPERIKRRLERLALFSSVSLPELYLTESGHGGLLVRVAEGSPNSFDGLIGYVPTRQQESGFFTGLVHVQFRNLLGTGRKLSTRWYRENQLTQEVEIRYFEPWIASYPFNGLVDFFQRRQDSTYVRRNYGLSLEFMVSEVLMFGVAYSQANVIPSEGYARSILAESRQWSVGGHVRYDTRDDPVTPTGGVLYRTEYRSGVKNTLNNLTNAPAARSSTRLVTMDLSHYFPFFSRQVLATEFHLRDFRADRIEVADLFKLGGATSLRGYKEGQFQGSTLSWMNAEYRFLAGSRSFFYIFADVGYVVVPENVAGGLSKSEQTKAGFGVGVRMESGLGLIGVNLGFGEGDTFSTAKLHVRLVNEF